MTYKVYWVPNVPRDPFYVDVSTPAEGFRILNVLAEYDLYLGEDLIATNSGGLLDADGDSEWFNDQGEDVWEAHAPLEVALA